MTEYFNDITFAHPWVLFFLLVLIPLGYWSFLRRNTQYNALRMPTSSWLDEVPASWDVKLRPMLPILRLLTIAAIIVAIARPQSVYSEESIQTEGIDIAIALDVSSSMLAVDFKPNRIEAGKRTAVEFIEGRPQDRIGLVVFAGEVFTQCPITLDHELLSRLVGEADTWQLEDGTALGDGLGLAVTRLMDSTAVESKVIILLTDGVQNAGHSNPLDVATAASQLGMRVYTVGIGSRNERVEMRDRRGAFLGYLNPEMSLDEEVLKEIAERTGGRYYRATSNSKLREIYEEIDQLEKQKIEVSVARRYQDKFYPFAFLAAGFLFLEILLGQTIFRSLT
jgi:Ca-activated chloride channel family protein